MRHFALAAALMLAPVTASAQTADPVVREILVAHILPRFEALATRSQDLAEAATAECTPTSPDLRAAYGAAFDAWISASHLRFGPTEVDDRAFALAFWPDSRGATPRSLSTLIADEDPIAASVEDYADMSIAARGFHALEFLLYDDALMVQGNREYRCQLVRTMTGDIAATTQSILDDWRAEYGEALLTPGPQATFRSDDEVRQQLFGALTTGLEFNSDTRLGRPLGTFERPRPTRAEAWRSGRSAVHVALSLTALRDLAIRLAAEDAALVDTLEDGFADALAKLDALDDPIFAGTAQPQGRLKIEIVQQAVDAVRALVRDRLGPTLGVAAGFNALDGD